MNKKLAINGGKKTINNVDGKHYIWPPITESTKQAVLKQLDESISIYDRSGIIEELETRLSRYFGKKYALLTSSGTAALYSAFVGANLQPDDEIICPAYTFFATITPLFFTGAVPVLADSRQDGNIDPIDIERRITKKTKGIIVTHMWGIPCEMNTIAEIAKKYNLLLFEDASHAHGSVFKGGKVGTFGDASAFSLQGQKTLTGGEGGFLLTDNNDLFTKALLLGHYNNRCKKEIAVEHPLYKFSTTGMGLKLRIHPIAAAIANQQFDNLEELLKSREIMAKKMYSKLAGLPGIELPKIPDDVTSSWYAFVMQYKPEDLEGLSIEKFYKALIAEGCIELDRPGSTCPLNYHPLFQNPEILFPFYKGKLSYNQGDFPVAEKFHNNSLKLPVWHNSDDEKMIDLYITAFYKVIDNYKELL
jgi:dTDP-4-amino-4,6-dideoxygalactose transaminase